MTVEVRFSRKKVPKQVTKIPQEGKDDQLPEKQGPRKEL